jgi:hypothetical protein
MTTVPKRPRPGRTHAAPPAHRDGAWRHVDRDDLVAALLEVEGDAAGAAADIEHAPAHESQRAPLHGEPAPERRVVER